jgi:hypothetical protein
MKTEFLFCIIWWCNQAVGLVVGNGATCPKNKVWSTRLCKKVRVAGPHEELSHPYWGRAVQGQLMGFMISGEAGGMTICDP